MDLVKSVELFAKSKHAGQFREDGITPYSKHLDDVVNRLKSLGIIDEQIFCAGWLHDTIEKTETTFDDLYEQFESEIAVLVSSISKDMKLTRKKRERAYTTQLKESSFSAKLIKLCDISANLGELKNSTSSKSKKLRLVKQQRHYLSIIKNDILGNPNYPYVQSLIESANVIFIKFNQRPISVQLKS
ncbi:bifunctional (p)ppGpp synthetase/guanosine-3',5'-bis(diphosphate) 3'-pyrophosphohydrolase [Nitrosopumilus oxyclinae]|uniref:Bifunctional (P)ppGpp synthetase/guanosine-3',5'-bis(Diphosphate) 3'-pyrophosphohydrolase n=1 Tax=Nitrosopumilus oxyclinae TaxID=1959104 RepID=A0A7D5M449_9ARCH|nr:HD domain-containing protein [Nitrosopumilus oxyclinae]QLH04090.1 bifunctional (p)ppGpp synthetase/guanosine-3',5'-bis(diphosphate) 3'-pyrophosphohydrolase [Nitrosopumilus oxyclinae]